MLLRAEEGAYDLADDHGDFRIEAEEFIVCDRLDLASHMLAFWIIQDKRELPEYAELEGDPLFAGYYRQP